MKLALLALLAAGCAARTYRPTRPAVGWDDALRVRVDHLDVVGVELTVTARVSGVARLGAIRLARGDDPPCREGRLARRVLVDGTATVPIGLVLEGERTVEATFEAPDLDARLAAPAALDLDTDGGCIRVPLVRADGVVEWVEDPRWSIGAGVGAIGPLDDEASLGWGVLASLRVARVRGRFDVGGAIQLGRADGDADWDHVDLLGVAPSAGARLLDHGRWAVAAIAAYDLIVPVGSSPEEKRFLALIHGPRLGLRAGYGGGDHPSRAFRSRRSATLFGIEVGAAWWAGAGWVGSAGLVLELGR